MTEPYWTRLSRAPLSRRQALAGASVAAATLAAAATVSCRTGDKNRSPGASGTQTPRRGGVLRTGTSLPVSSGLDPQIESGTGLEIFPRVYGYLLHIDPDTDATLLDHAVSVEQPDETTVIVRLRPDVRFQDLPPVNGRPVVAADAARSIQRYRDNPLVLNKTWHNTILDRVEATDATTLRIVTKQPNVYSLSEIGAISGGAIIPTELIDAAADLSASGVGSGPFRIEQAPAGGPVRIVRHEAYFAAPLPYLDAMEWMIFSDDAERVAALTQQQIDVAPNRDRAEAQRIGRDLPAVEVTSEASLAYLSIGLRVDRPPFNDPRVREAIDIGLDRDAMIRDIAFEEGEVLGPVSPHIAGGFWSLPRGAVIAAQRGDQPIEQRRASATAMIQQAGAAAMRIRLQVAKVPQLLDVATVVRDQLQRIGLMVDLETLDLLPWFVNLRRGDFAMTLISQFPYESPDAPTRLYHSAGIDGTKSPFGFSDAGIEALVERSWREQDRDARRQTLLDAQRLMIQARPLIQLFTSKAYTSAWKYVRDRKPELRSSLAQYNYGQWLDQR